MMKDAVSTEPYLALGGRESKNLGLDEGLSLV